MGEYEDQGEFVHWDTVDSLTFYASSSAVQTVEQCPMCVAAMEMDPSSLGEISCENKHYFSFKDDGHVVEISTTSSKLRAQAVGGEEHYVLNLEREGTLRCPRCRAMMDTLFNNLSTITRGEQFYTRCANHHEFASYVRTPKLYLFDVTDGVGTPFDTT